MTEAIAQREGGYDLADLDVDPGALVTAGVLPAVCWILPVATSRVPTATGRRRSRRAGSRR